MDLLNNLNTLISIVVGIFGIGGYFFGITAYLRNKATSSQQKQTIQGQSSQRRSPYQTVSRPLSKLDWMQVLWGGLEDAIRARGGGGVMVSGGIFVFVTVIITGSPSVDVTLVVVFYVLFFSLNLLFYVYFVGRRVEKKVEDINQPLTQKSRTIQNI